MVYCVGLTGNLASGKSTAATFFSALGVQIINADQISRELTAKNHAAYHEIIQHFGSEIVDENGELNRKILRTIIFSDPNARKWLEQLLHPLIRQKIKEQVDLCTTAYCIVEIPLLIDKKTYPYINKILLIDAPQGQQISRVMQRDQCSRKQALAILASQPEMSLRLKNADDVFVNDSGIEALKTAITHLHHKYLREA